ncbi:HD domain-containing protein [Chitinispirillales bacterium ANBcel5]|uniref:HD domain-containing protein n=1 Tax=Cellulosispirillum alkaliphilum TaxID=3039283 RepID=UPI002A583051|nr:HD domain-containing protein [Chitinispirillales bacterium ANBcel5]
MKIEFDISRFLIEDEEKLSPYAKKSSESFGRQHPIKRDPFRLEFARDETRILHSPPFRRLKHKTQVFLSPNNDHICTRMEHVLHVSSIASVIGRCLSLNIDLINAIARGHDLGHPPFGHAGERVLNKLIKNRGVENGFKHEVHGLRVVDKLTNYGKGLNLTYEVRDGIITHCGESFDRVVTPDRSRCLLELEQITDRCHLPATLEGCLVRLVDRIAYLGRDLEDAIKAGLIKKNDIPPEISKGLGSDNGKIIGSFVNNVIANSVGHDAIIMSEEVFELMKQLKNFNYTHIYLHPEVERKSKKATYMLELLYTELEKIFDKTERGQNSSLAINIIRETPTMENFFNFIKNTNYNEKTPSWRIITDYIAGMTDLYAERVFSQLFMPAPVI